MARPFIEFIQSQSIAWNTDPVRTGRQDIECKLLSEDNISGASSLLIRFPPGWHATPLEWCSVDEEIFVLSGDVSFNGQTMRRHAYAYWPAGYRRERFEAGAQGAILLTFYSGRPEYWALSGPPEYWALRDRAPVYDPEALVEHLDSFKLRWDQTAMDPNIAHLNAFRKNLRLGPNGSGRTYLLAGLPQGYPTSGSEPLERHPHVEEMFMVAGDMPCSLGIMRAGAYFWRPPQIWHGADCTVNGFLLFMRTPGSNQTISEWSRDNHPVRFDPEHRPRVPDTLAPLATPVADPVTY